MSTKARGGNFENPSEGTVQAVVSNIYDIGLQKTVSQFGEKTVYQVIITFELNETMTRGEYAGKRFVISRTYVNVISKKSNLKRDIAILVGEEKAVPGFELEDLIGVNCILQLEQNDKGYVNVVGMTAPMKDMVKMVPELPRDHKPDWIAKKQREQIFIEQEPEMFADPKELEKEKILNQLKEMRDNGTITPSQLTATTRAVCKRDCKTSEATLEELRKIKENLTPLTDGAEFNPDEAEPQSETNF